VDSAGHMPCSSRHGDRHQTGILRDAECRFDWAVCQTGA